MDAQRVETGVAGVPGAKDVATSVRVEGVPQLGKKATCLVVRPRLWHAGLEAYARAC